MDPSTLSPQEISDLIANGWVHLACDIGNEYTAELDNIVAKVRVFFEVDHSTGDIRFRPMHAVNPERDIWVDFDLVSQFGPCVDNVMAIIDDCRDNDELEIELEGMLQERLALIFKSKLTPLNQATNAFNEILKAFKSGLTLPPGLLGLFIGDVDGVNEDAIYFITK